MHDAKAALATLEILSVESELRAGTPDCDDYEREEYASNQEGDLEAEIIAELGGVYSPYTDEWFDQPTSTDIEHIVAASEAHRSGMCRPDRAAARKFFGRDHLNLTLAGAVLNQDEKIDCDAADWLPDKNRCWFAGRVVKVKALYGLAVNRSEYKALRAALEVCQPAGMATRGSTSASPVRKPVKRFGTCEDLYRYYPCGLRKYHKGRNPPLYRMNVHLRISGDAVCGRPSLRED